VPNEQSGTISVIDTGTRQVVGEWRVGEKPRGIIASADGLRLFVTEQPDGLRIIDARTGELVQRLSLGASPVGLALAAWPTAGRGQ
jgi:YVTN family beta-propeller protein